MRQTAQKMPKTPKKANRKKCKNWNETHAHPQWRLLAQKIWKTHIKTPRYARKQPDLVGLSEKNWKNEEKIISRKGLVADFEIFCGEWGEFFLIFGINSLSDQFCLNFGPF